MNIHPAIAALPNVQISVSSDSGQIQINLTEIIQAPAVDSVSNPANGSATISCTPQPCVTYTPNPGFVGLDTFNYSIDIGEGFDSGLIAVTVGNAALESQGLIPTKAVDDTLTLACLQFQPNSNIADLCAEFDAATNSGVPADLRELLDALSPNEIAAQATLSSDLASQQLTTVARRLAAIRSGQVLSVTGDLARLDRQKSATGGLLAGIFDSDVSGGGASADGFTNQWGWFLSANTGGGEQKETDFEDGFEFDSSGLSGGIDYRIGNQGVIGAALGLATTTTKIDLDAGGMDVEATSVTLYGSHYPSDRSYLDLVFNSNFQTFESQRHIVFGTTNTRAKSENDGRTLALSIAGGYDLIQSDFTWGLETKLEYIKSTIDAFSETGGSPFNVSITDREFTQSSIHIGSRFSLALSNSWGVIIPQLDLVVVHQFDEDPQIIQGYFTADPKKTTFRFNANTPDVDYFKIDVGASAVFVGGSSGFAQLGTTLARDDYKNWHVSLGLRLEL